MRPTFLGFQTALRGINANQKAMDIVGQNLTNINTPGYTRQRVDLVAMRLGANDRYSGGQNLNSLAGQGSRITGIGQIRDSFLDKRFREEYSSTAYYDKTASVLDDIEGALDEITSKGLKDSFTNIFNALQSFSKNPDQVTHAGILMNTMVQFSQVMRQFDSKLDDISDQQQFDLQISVNDVNSILERVANLNKSISEAITVNTAVGGTVYGPNELLDERNLLLDQLAQYGKIRVDDRGDGIVDVSMGGHSVVTGYNHETLNYAKTYDGPITLTWQSDGVALASPNGSLKASFDMINGAGPLPKSPFETFEKGVPYYKQKLDELAIGFANAFNNVIPQTVPPGTFKVLFEPSNMADMSAADIRVTDAWLTNAGYVMSNVATNGEINNDYILSMINLFSKSQNYSEFSGTFEQYVNFVNTTIGQQKTFNTSRLEATSAIADDMLNRRDAISAVSMDEEGADLMQYDKAYKAVARVMTTLDEALETLLNMGVVGR